MASFTPQQIEQFLQEFFDVVGSRQYVGARYVPVFGHGGDSPIEWDGGAEAYEPLSIVYHRGETYTSRQYVPAGVDIHNTDYWVVTANYNAQMEQYRQEVLSFQDEIDAANAAVDILRDDVADDYVPFPDPDHYPKYGTTGQVLSTLADGTTKWENPVVPSDAQAEQVITQWLDDHPEATTTVLDGAITTPKIANGSVTDAKLAQSGGVLETVSDLKKELKNESTAMNSTDGYAANPLNLMLNSSANWTGDGTGSHVMVPVNPGDSVVITTGSSAAYFCVLRSFDVGESGQHADVSEQTGFTGRLTVAANTISTPYTMPSDAAYISFNYRSGDSTFIPDKVEINGESVIPGIRNSVNALYDNKLQGYKLSNGFADNFDDLSHHWGGTRLSLTAQNNILTATQSGTVSNNTNIEYVKSAEIYISGHLYYMSYEVYPIDNDITLQFYLFDRLSPETTCVANSWQTVDIAFTAGGYADDISIRMPMLPSNAQVRFKNPIIIDLTNMFGDNATNIKIDMLREISKDGFDLSYINKRLQTVLLTNNIDSTNAYVVIASAGSKYESVADFVTDGDADEMVINQIINDNSVKDIFITSDSVITVHSEIKLKSNLTIHSDGAKIQVPADIVTTETSAVVAGASTITVNDDTFLSGISVGSFIELYDVSHNDAAYVASKDTTNKTITVDGTIGHSYDAGYTLRNVSSVFSAEDCENVVIKGFTITTNFDGDTANRSYNTFWAQNGLHTINCSNIRVEDCNFIDGGRHGILFYQTTYSSITNCLFDTWGEHGIDIYSPNGATTPGPRNGNKISGCTCNNSLMCGIQLHTGSGTVISDCTCKNNGRDGISMQQNANGNIVSNCLIEENNQRGIWVNLDSADITIVGCNLRNNDLDGIQLDTSVSNVTISGCTIINDIKRSTKKPHAILLYNASNCIISGNSLLGGYATSVILIDSSSDDNFITGNLIEKRLSDATTGIIENSGDYNIITNNVFKGLTTDATISGEHTVAQDNY